ncbi:MAG: hypothetical protein JXB48_15590 [Candidatus Latescibacteria bacterium]|nr:hypothetical protein [Candidatus Latescibacterota bacterium]
MSCNNPFKTRTPVEPPSGGGVAIKPANSPENVLYNMKIAFNNYSIQDYLDVFSEDFVFAPDTEDSIAYEDRFITSWDKNRESEFATNLFTKIRSDSLVDRSVEIILSSYEYKSGNDMYEYSYVIEQKDETAEIPVVTLRGRAWLYLREYPDGKWYIYMWLDRKVQLTTMTWGVLRALNI